MQKTIDNYIDLANAIIVQACKDYLYYLSYAKKTKDRIKKQRAIEETESIERFFRSQWFRELTDVDGEYLIERLREKAEKGEK